MLCKKFYSVKYWMTILVIGVLAFTLGVVGMTVNMKLPGNSDMLLGMFTGLGGSFIVISVIMLLISHFKSAEKRKLEIINQRDERNVQITRSALSVSSIAALLLFAIMAFVLVALDYEIPSVIAIGAMWVQAIVFLVARAIIGNRM